MQKKFMKLLKKLRRRYIERHDLPQPRPLNKEMNPDIISSHIREKLLSPEPCMLSRFGAVEIGCVVNYLGIYHQKRKIIKYIKGVAEKNPALFLIGYIVSSSHHQGNASPLMYLIIFLF